MDHPAPPTGHGGGSLERPNTRKPARQPLADDLWSHRSGRDPFPAPTRY